MPFSATRELWLVLKARDEANRALRSFSSNVRDAGRQVQMAEALANKADAQRLLRMQRLRGASAAEMQDTKNLIDGYDRQYRQLKVLDTQQEQHRQTLMRYNQQLNSVSATAATAGIVLTSLGVGAMFAVGGIIKSAVIYENQVRKTLTQVDGFKTSIEELSQIGLEVGRNVAVPLDELQSSLYDIFSSTSANAKQAKILLDAFAKTAVAGQVDLQDASRGTISIMNAFNVPFENVNKILDVEFQLVRKGVGTYEEFAKVFGRVIPSATRAGQSFETVAAMLAFMTRNGLSAAMASTSAARALDAFSHPKAVKALEDLGVKMRDAKGNLLPLVDVLEQFRAKLMQLPVKDRVGTILETFKGAGGTQQARRFIEQVLLRPGELEEFKGFLKDMQNSSGAFSTAYNEMADTTASKTQLLANRWQAVKVAAGNALIPTFTKVVDWLGKMFEWYNKLPKSQQDLIAKAVAFAAVLTTLLGVLLLVVSGVAALGAAMVVAGPEVFAVTGIILGLVAAFVGLSAALTAAFKNSQDFRDIIKTISDTLKKLYDEAILPTANGIKEAWDKYIVPAFENLNKVIQEKVMPIVKDLTSYITEKLLPIAKELGNWIKDNLTIAFKTIGNMINKYVIPAITDITNWYHRHEGAVKNVISAVMWLVKEVLKLATMFSGPLIAAFAIIVLPIVNAIETFIFITEVIGKVVDKVKDLIHWFSTLDDTFGKVLGTVGQTFKDVEAKMGKIKDSVIGFFKDAATWLYHAGKDMMMGLANGIIDFAKNPLGAIKGTINSLIDGAKRALDSHSPSRKFMKLGRDAVAGFILGFNGLSTSVPTAVGNIVKTMGTGNIIGSSTSGGVGSNVNQVINVYTNEIDPRRHSQEIGFLLGARV
jgi:TP901 family phage tail tape measure protein